MPRDTNGEGMSRRKKEPEAGARVSVQYRLSDSLYLDREEFETARPLISGELGFITLPWPVDWFFPAGKLLLFPYVGSFESRFSVLWFACDGKEVPSFEAGLGVSFREMKASTPKTPLGEVDTERLASFNHYLRPPPASPREPASSHKTASSALPWCDRRSPRALRRRAARRRTEIRA
jgi:hypothetical protein